MATCRGAEDGAVLLSCFCAQYSTSRFSPHDASSKLRDLLGKTIPPSGELSGNICRGSHQLHDSGATVQLEGLPGRWVWGRGRDLQP